MASSDDTRFKKELVRLGLELELGGTGSMPFLSCARSLGHEVIRLRGESQCSLHARLDWVRLMVPCSSFLGSHKKTLGQCSGAGKGRGEGHDPAGTLRHRGTLHRQDCFRERCFFTVASVRTKAYTNSEKNDQDAHKTAL